MSFTRTLAAAAVFISAAGLAAADGHAPSWTLVPDMSSVSFGSIKNDYVGESHTFTGLSGGVSGAGAMALDIDLGSVQTNIDIRNERMIEHVFKAAPSATVSAEVDMAEFSGLAVGETAMSENYATLALLGTDLDVDVKLFVMRLSDDRVMVLSDGMAMLSTEDAGINAGIDILQGLASLDSITRVSPVSFRLVFEQAN